MLTRIVVAAQSAEVRQRVGRLLENRWVHPELISDEDALWGRLAHEDFDLVVVEEALLSASPGDFVKRLKGLPDQPDVIVLTTSGQPEQRADLLSLGCQAVLWLGSSDRTLGDALAALVRRHDEIVDRLGAERPSPRSTLEEFVSRSPAMQRFLRLAGRVVQSDSAVLILGETGVGKERLARSLHAESRRAAGPFITLNCGALPESLLESELFGHEEGAFTGATRARRGYFELAHRGTLFLDEIGEMPAHLQVKLLRALEDRRIQRLGGERPIEVDVRVIAATNRELAAEMEVGRFRRDLYFRLAVVTLTVPPLRERREDIPELALFFLDRSRRQLGRAVTGIRPAALQALVAYDWPGNARELANVIERAVLLSASEQIDLADLRAGESFSDGGALPSPEAPQAPPASPALPTVPAPIESWLDWPLVRARAQLVTEFEARYLRHLLRRTRGRMGEAAKRAGMNPRSLYALLKRHGLRKEDFKR